MEHMAINYPLINGPLMAAWHWYESSCVTSPCKLFSHHRLCPAGMLVNSRRTKSKMSILIAFNDECDIFMRVYCHVIRKVSCHNTLMQDFQSIPIADQYWSNLYYWFQYRSMQIIANHFFALISIEKYFRSLPEFWLVLIGINWHWA